MPNLPALTDFPARTVEKLRYADTDRQGHVNNAIFATMLETGRVELLYAPDAPIFEAGCAFVIASLHLDFLGEVTWPGQVDIGTRVASIGKSSVTLEQALFQRGVCVAQAKTVIVQMNEATRRSQPFSETSRERLSRWAGSTS
ncbi:MAG: thioesterase family protein [Myxococcaceae bacterium]|nr:thioesterase family protein [Myxococcaceae bacterium]